MRRVVSNGRLDVALHALLDDAISRTYVNREVAGQETLKSAKVFKVHIEKHTRNDQKTCVCLHYWTSGRESIRGGLV